MTDWDVLTLEQAGVTLLDCDHKTPAAREAGRPYVGIPQMTTGRVIFETARKISEEDYIHWTRKTKYQTDDVILSRRTNPGVTAVDDTGTDFALGQNLVLLRADGSRVRPDFLRWMVHTPQWWEQIDKYLNVGAVFSSLKCRDVPKFELTVPPIAEQQKINSILRPIADKIELNRRMNETLEEMARALFRDWFVDFGPTRRQMGGATDPAAIMGHALPPEKAATLAPLFPAKVSDDGLPEGWSFSDVGSEFDVVMGQSPPGDTYNETGEGLPFFQGRRDFGFRFPSRRVYCTEPKRISGHDWTLLSVRAPVGDINRAAEKCAIGRGVGAFLHKAGLHSFTYYTGLALRTELQSYDKDGTVFGSINQKQFKGLQVVVPDQGVAARFDEVAKPIDEKIRLNTKEIQTLAEMRDLLLPKLMSGEIRLKDAEAEV